MSEQTTLFYNRPSAEPREPLRPTRKYLVPWVIEGVLEIEATDRATAELAASYKSQEELAQQGELSMFEPEEAETTQ